MVWVSSGDGMDIRDNSLDRFMWEELKLASIPETVYHYTTIDTFAKLLADEADFYCTHYKALNDDSEFRLGILYALNYFDRKGVRSTSPHKFVGDAFLGMMHQKVLVPWITSFSGARDSLPQWIAYTKDSGGYAIGFRYRDIHKAVSALMTRQSALASQRISKMKKMIYLLPCIYIEADGGLTRMMYRSIQPSDVADRLLEFLLGEYQDNLAAIFEPRGSQVREAIVAAVLLFASMVKHVSFSHEQEYRLVVQARLNKDTLKRCELIGGKPRIHSNVNKIIKPLRLSISEIGRSPHGNLALLDSTAELFRLKYGCEYGLYRSTSPYNGR